MDSFSQDWGKLPLWMNPPFSRLGEVVDKVRRDEAHCIMVVPDWGWAQWHKQLMLMTQRSLIIP